MPEWLKGADCKSAVARLRWFESTPAHHKKGNSFYYFLFYFVFTGGREPTKRSFVWFERERAKGEGVLFGKNEIFENKNHSAEKND